MSIEAFQVQSTSYLGCVNMSHSYLSTILQQVGSLLSKALILSRALLPDLLAPLIILFSVPIYIIRYGLSKWAEYYSSGAIGEPISPSGNMFAPELHPNFISRPPRCAIVTTITLQGLLPTESIVQRVNNQLLAEHNGRAVRYPELMQYIDSWFGFMFWKSDPDFKLEDHIKSHKIEGKSDSEIEEELRSFTEHLLNKPFLPRKSPWEAFVVHSGKRTKILFRLHHALADGYSVTNILLEGLAGVSYSSVSIPAPKNVNKLGKGWGKVIKQAVSFPLRVGYDATYFFASMHAPKTPWHVPDEEKSWMQIYERSDAIPIGKIKTIKNSFGVSFTGVLLSCVSAGISVGLNKKIREKQGFKKGPNSISVATILPLPDHPDKLANHLTGTAFQLPTRLDLTSEQRLQKVEKLLELAKQSTLPLLQRTAALLLNTNLAPVASFCWHNRYFPVGFTNMPGPTVAVSVEGLPVEDVDFAVGGQLGVLGVNFMVLSFGNHIRFGITAEKAVMNRVDVKELIEVICNEISVLYKSCSRSNLITK